MDVAQRPGPVGDGGRTNDDDANAGSAYEHACMQFLCAEDYSGAKENDAVLPSHTTPSL